MSKQMTYEQFSADNGKFDNHWYVPIMWDKDSQVVHRGDLGDGSHSEWFYNLAETDPEYSEYLENLYENFGEKADGGYLADDGSFYMINNTEIPEHLHPQWREDWPKLSAQITEVHDPEVDEEHVFAGRRPFIYHKPTDSLFVGLGGTHEQVAYLMPSEIRNGWRRHETDDQFVQGMYEFGGAANYYQTPEPGKWTTTTGFVPLNGPPPDPMYLTAHRAVQQYHEQQAEHTAAYNPFEELDGDDAGSVYHKFFYNPDHDILYVWPVGGYDGDPSHTQQMYKEGYSPEDQNRMPCGWMDDSAVHVYPNWGSREDREQARQLAEQYARGLRTSAFNYNEVNWKKLKIDLVVLASSYGVMIMWQPGMRWEESVGYPDQDMIYLPSGPIDSDLKYAIALHEIGHFAFQKEYNRLEHDFDGSVSTHEEELWVDHWMLEHAEIPISDFALNQLKLYLDEYEYHAPTPEPGYGWATQSSATPILYKEQGSRPNDFLFILTDRGLVFGDPNDQHDETLYLASKEVGDLGQELARGYVEGQKATIYEGHVPLTIDQVLDILIQSGMIHEPIAKVYSSSARGDLSTTTDYGFNRRRWVYDNSSGRVYFGNEEYGINPMEKKDVGFHHNAIMYNNELFSPDVTVGYLDPTQVLDYENRVTPEDAAQIIAAVDAAHAAQKTSASAAWYPWVADIATHRVEFGTPSVYHSELAFRLGLDPYDDDPEAGWIDSDLRIAPHASIGQGNYNNEDEQWIRDEFTKWRQGGQVVRSSTEYTPKPLPNHVQSIRPVFVGSAAHTLTSIEIPNKYAAIALELPHKADPHQGCPLGNPRLHTEEHLSGYDTIPSFLGNPGNARLSADDSEFVPYNPYEYQRWLYSPEPGLLFWDEKPYSMRHAQALYHLGLQGSPYVGGDTTPGGLVSLDHPSRDVDLVKEAYDALINAGVPPTLIPGTHEWAHYAPFLLADTSERTSALNDPETVSTFDPDKTPRVQPLEGEPGSHIKFIYKPVEDVLFWWTTEDEDGDPWHMHQEYKYKISAKTPILSGYIEPDYHPVFYEGLDMDELGVPNFQTWDSLPNSLPGLYKALSSLLNQHTATDTVEDRFEEHFYAIPFIWYEDQVYLDSPMAGHAGLVYDQFPNGSDEYAMWDQHEYDSVPGQYYVGRCFSDGEVLNWDTRYPIPDPVKEQVRSQVREFKPGFLKDEGPDEGNEGLHPEGGWSMTASEDYLITRFVYADGKFYWGKPGDFEGDGYPETHPQILYDNNIDRSKYTPILCGLVEEHPDGNTISLQSIEVKNDQSLEAEVVPQLRQMFPGYRILNGSGLPVDPVLDAEPANAHEGASPKEYWERWSWLASGRVITGQFQSHQELREAYGFMDDAEFGDGSELARGEWYEYNGGFVIAAIFDPQATPEALAQQLKLALPPFTEIRWKQYDNVNKRFDSGTLNVESHFSSTVPYRWVWYPGYGFNYGYEPDDEHADLAYEKGMPDYYGGWFNHDGVPSISYVPGDFYDEDRPLQEDQPEIYKQMMKDRRSSKVAAIGDPAVVAPDGTAYYTEEGYHPELYYILHKKFGDEVQDWAWGYLHDDEFSEGSDMFGMRQAPEITKMIKVAARYVKWIYHIPTGQTEVWRAREGTHDQVAYSLGWKPDEYLAGRFYPQDNYVEHFGWYGNSEYQGQAEDALRQDIGRPVTSAVSARQLPGAGEGDNGKFVYDAANQYLYWWITNGADGMPAHHWQEYQNGAPDAWGDSMLPGHFTVDMDGAHVTLLVIADDLKEKDDPDDERLKAQYKPLIEEALTNALDQYDPDLKFKSDVFDIGLHEIRNQNTAAGPVNENAFGPPTTNHPFTTAYHVAPVTARDEIEEHGLNQSENYVWRDASQAEEYARNRIDPVDIWAVDVKGVPLKLDPEGQSPGEYDPYDWDADGQGYVTPSKVDMSRIRRVGAYTRNGNTNENAFGPDEIHWYENFLFDPADGEVLFDVDDHNVMAYNHGWTDRYGVDPIGGWIFESNAKPREYYAIFDSVQLGQATNYKKEILEALQEKYPGIKEIPSESWMWDHQVEEVNKIQDMYSASQYPLEIHDVPPEAVHNDFGSTERLPIIYHPTSNEVFVGPFGSHHGPVKYKYQLGNTVDGFIYRSDDHRFADNFPSNVVHWMGTPPEDVKTSVQDYLGATRSRRFTDEFKYEDF